ncbi:MAG: Tad domain-containing protein [Pirellulaceae bacterium]
MTVRVTASFDSFTWLPVPKFLAGMSYTASCVMPRQAEPGEISSGEIRHHILREPPMTSLKSLRKCGARDQRCGATLVLVVLLLVVILGVAAFAVDFGRMQLVRSQLQTAVDAGALAGSLQLNKIRPM